MPELPDIAVYVDRLAERIVGQELREVRIAAPFLLRSVEPTPTEIRCRSVTSVCRIGKRVAIGLEGDFWLVMHLMIGGRLHWQLERPRLRSRNQLAAFDFSSGSLLLTEAGSKKRASLYLLRGRAALDAHDPGGIEPLECTFEGFSNMLDSENHTLKRALTNPHMFSGIGNAYSDEILHAARLSPVAQSRRLTEAEKKRLFDSVRSVLALWCHRLREQSATEFPRHVTAFRPGMAVHGRFGKPCPDCGAAVQRIRYKDHETNYCPRCQNRGRLLADRSLSRLLKDDWPRSLED